MEAPGSGNVAGAPLPLASMSLHALSSHGHLSRIARPSKATTPAVASVRDGPRSHPIAGPMLLPAESAHRSESSSSSSKKGPQPLQWLVRAVPMALGRLVTAPAKQSPFLQPGRLADARVFPSAVLRRAAAGNSGRPGAGGGRAASLVWFRSDLRLHDNPVLAAACSGSTSVLPVFVFDPRDYAQTPGGFSRTGPARAQFLLDAVADLRSRLRAAGSDLVVRVGRPEAVLPELAAAVGAGAVYCQAEVTAEETGVEGRVRAGLDKHAGGAELRAAWGGTLFHLEDLPFRLEAMPTSYADFRQRVAALRVRPLADSEQSIRGLPVGKVDAGELPTLQQLGLSAPPRPAPGARGSGSGLGAELRGGETEALRHLAAFMAELKSSLSRASKGGRTTAGGAAGPNPSSAFSCRISPWLAMGCLSPRRMYHEMQQQLGGSGAALAAPAAAGAAAPGGGGAGGGAGANWLVFELLWRDFFRFVNKKYALASTSSGRAAAPAGRAHAAPALAAA